MKDYMDRTVRSSERKMEGAEGRSLSLLQKAIYSTSKALLSLSLLTSPLVSLPALAAANPELVCAQFAYPAEILVEKKHGTCPIEVQKGLRFGVDVTTADVVSCFNKGALAEVKDYAF